MPRASTKTNGATRKASVNFYEEPKSLPMVSVPDRSQQMLEKVNAEIAARQAKSEMQISRLVGTVAAINSAIPAIERAIGDPNDAVNTLAQLMSESGNSAIELITTIDIEDME